ncbi:hypothetical protein NQ166_04410 [Microbacterium sp. zg.Y1090]|uniref:hypothetical protein n=1 Tax=Microbacterium wangruii TaxID=3049073 RepID=UPI00214BE952|nr:MULTISPECIES: hypothetical protein [unclassified Microbacterium]MCR2818074.1 hypothetical protein [Microbacterium sp. zg.Y1090]WIM27768.1 hypothetical protein QNO26_11505 [Microbacterium sp. zg-Y1090]
MVRRSALFGISIVASTLVGLFSIPVLISRFGADLWGLLAVMQVACQFFAVLVAFGWGATGPSMVSALPAHQRKSVFRQSLAFRGVLFLVLAPVAAITCLLLTGQPTAVVALAAVSYVTPGLSAAWYLVGTNRPVALFFWDALPAILGQVAGLLVVLVVPELWAYLLCTAIAGVGGAVGSAIYVLTRRSDGRVRGVAPTPTTDLVRSQFAGVSSTMSASVWTAAPLVLVQALAPAAAPVYAVVDRFMKYGVLALAPVLQAVQGWVPEAGQAEVRTRALQAVRVSIGVGGLGGVLLAALATPVSAVLTLDEATMPWIISVICGAAFLGECVAQIVGLSSLVALGGARQLAVSSLASAILGVPLMALLIGLWGLIGAAVGLFIVASALAVYRVAHARRLAVARGAAEAV